MFVRILNGGHIGEPLLPASVSEILKRVAVFVWFTANDANVVSGHSMRVGATHDLPALNIDLGAVVQAGRRKSNRMPVRYGEHVMAARGGISRAAVMQGTNAPDGNEQE